MARTLQTLLAKLKRRRESWKYTPWSGMADRKGDHDGAQDPVPTEQMAALNVSTSSEDPVPLGNTASRTFIFGFSPEFAFEFKPTICTTWPGPQYDQQSQFAPGTFDKARPSRPRSKHKSSKRRLSQEGGQASQAPGRAKVKPVVTAAKEVAKIKKVPRQVQYYGRPPPRDPPLRLLNLPGEIRNRIYRILCVRDEPIVAQFRPIIKPKSGLVKRAKLFEATRRFPREPVLALCCHQLQNEVLSTFYSDNKFIFRQSDDQKFKDLVMTNCGIIERWAPKSGLASSLTHIELHFNITPVFGGKEAIIYTLRKHGDGPLCITNNAEDHGYCTCFDKFTLKLLKAVFEKDIPWKSLIQTAAKLADTRAMRLYGDPRMINHGSKYRPMLPVCSDCGLESLRVLEDGNGL